MRSIRMLTVYIARAPPILHYKNFLLFWLGVCRSDSDVGGMRIWNWKFESEKWDVQISLGGPEEIRTHCLLFHLGFKSLLASNLVGSITRKTASCLLGSQARLFNICSSMYVVHAMCRIYTLQKGTASLQVQNTDD